MRALFRASTGTRLERMDNLHLLEYINHHPWLAGGAVLALALVVVYELRARSESFSTVSPQEAVRLLNQGAYVIDLRPAEAYASGHVSGAKQMTGEQILKANDVPLNRMVDIRSNPVLRQQIQAVVRRAAEQQAPAAQPAAAGGPAPVVTPPQPSIAQRLQELETLRASGAVSDQEYNSRRAEIISEI